MNKTTTPPDADRLIVPPITTPPTYKFKARTYTVVREGVEPVRDLRIVTTAADAAVHLTTELAQQDEGREHFAVLFMDRERRVLWIKTLSSATGRECAVYPAEIARHAILCGARFIILAHNHPGGDLAPSAEDLILTRWIEGGLQLLDIRVLDHLIVAGETWRALRVGAGWWGD